MTSLLGDLMDRAPVAVRSCRVEARSESTSDHLDIAGAGGLEHAIAVGNRSIEGCKMGPESAPALKAMVVGNGKLRLIEPCIRSRGAQRSKPLLCGFPQPLDIGIR